ncbi:MAG TPA: glucose-6-phosphate isomerase [Alphaproteobacteria bacterium]|nr:glucose-6-phosphate isomerase [Alphaproteobacteria bacterium]
MVALDQSPAWKQLAHHRDAMKLKSLSEIILGDPRRMENCELALGGLTFNYAFNAVTDETIDLLVKLAQFQGIEQRREQMFRGDTINVTEKRAVLHTALRQKDGKPVMVDGRNVIEDIKAARAKMVAFAKDVREGRWLGATGKPIKHVVNIGIGGSDLGPRLATEALASYVTGLQVHYVANADAFDLQSTLKNCDAEETLFVVVSKTFTTQETLLNANSARKWLTDKLGDAAVAQHFVAVSTNQKATEAFGIPESNMFPMWDWVGGRFSLWSAVGLSLMLAIGPENFQKLCDGAAAMDDHFHTAPLAKNIPVLFALFGIWHRNFHDAHAVAILPYSERLRNLPRYLQQLDMESNGKPVTRDGKPIDYETAPIIFGECGTVGQHSFHQWLHQGSDIVPADFIGVREDDLNAPDHHRVMLSNMVAQMGALAFGQAEGKTPHDVYTGNRSSNFILLDHLDPECLGMLIALYEHKIFVQGAVWDINSFDQPGVELGKKLAKMLESPQGTPAPSQAFMDAFMRRATPKSKK